MASRFWVAGDGNWDASTTTHWSTVSGGDGGASVPTSADDVFFDANSNIAYVIVSTTVNCNNINLTGFLGTLNSSGNQTVTVNASMTLGDTATIGNLNNQTVEFKFTSTSAGNTISFGKANIEYMDSFTFDGVGGEWTIQDDLIWNARTTRTNRTIFTVTNGKLFTNGRTLQCEAMLSNNSNTRTIDLTNSTIYIYGSLATTWNFATTAGLTFVSTGSTIIYTPSFNFSTNANLGSQTYNNFSILTDPSTGGTSSVKISGSNIFNSLSISNVTGNGQTVQFTAGTTQTCTSFSVNGVQGQLVTLKSATNASAWTISVPSGTVQANYVSLRDSTAIGGATFIADENSTFVSGNTGWRESVVAPIVRQGVRIIGP